MFLNQLNEADHDYDSKVSDREQWLRRTQKLQANRASVEVERNRLVASSTVSLIDGGNVQGWWDGSEPQQRWEVVRPLLASITVQPARNLGGKTDGDRFDLNWAA